MSTGTSTSDPHDVERNLHDALPLEREHHDDGEEERDERDGGDAWNEHAPVPVLALERPQAEAAGHSGQERDAEVDEHAPGDLGDGDVDLGPLQPQPAGQDGDEDPGVDGEEEHLEDRVERDQAGAVFAKTRGSSS